MPLNKTMKKTYKKRAYKKRAPRVQRNIRAAAQGMDMTVKKIKFASTLKPGQGATVSNYLKYFLSPFNSNGSWLLRDLAEFRMWANIYDRYRISGVSIKILPRIDSITQAAVVSSAPANDSAGVYYVVQDRDSNAASSITQLKRMRSCKVYPQTKASTHYYNVRYPKGMWFDTVADINPGVGAPSYPMASQIGAVGGITIYGENFTERSGQVLNFIWADVEITFTVALQCYNPRSISLGEDGVVSVAVNDDADDVNKPVMTGTLSDELSGEVPVDE